jgi:DNA-binding MarR family transcriptional regulator
LENEGLVERLTDPGYQRGSLVRLTRRGVKAADAAIEAICSDQTTIGAAISGLSEEDREIGKQFLQRLLAKFEDANRSSPSRRPDEISQSSADDKSRTGRKKERA